MKKILLVFGTRPEAIKMAPLVLALKANKQQFDAKVCVTGQHREMLDQVLEIFDINPDFDLDLMKHNQELAEITSSILIGVTDVLRKTEPDLVLVHGDTTTTMAVTMACFYNRIQVGHVEAGLRTHNLFSPFPEEFNRQVVSRIANIHFAPTEICRNNLLSEGVPLENIFITGNTVIDALIWILSKIKNDRELDVKITKELNEKLKFDWKNNKFVLITGHRRENFGDGFQQICLALTDLSERFPEIKFVYPVHLNPNVKDPVYKILGTRSNIILIEPLTYLSFSLLLESCFFVLTDSGGIQEEAPSLRKPVLLMRNNTERPEGVMSGVIELVGANREQIVRSASRLFVDAKYYLKMANSNNPFGSGDSVERILKVLMELN